MQNINLLDNLTKAFEISTYEQSQDLFKKIVDLAAQKLLNKQVKDEDIMKKLKSKRIQSRLSIKKKSKRINKKCISKKNLRQYVIKKISISNRKTHQKYLQQKGSSFKKLYSSQRISHLLSLQLEKEQEKQESQQMQEVGQNMVQITKIRRVNNPLLNKFNQKVMQSCIQERVLMKFKKTHENFYNYLKLKQDEQKSEELTCPICIETLIEPVSSICGHSFCFSCLDESLLFSHTCPVCRLLIKGIDLIPCNYLSQLIRIKSQNKFMTPEETQNLQLRIKQNNEWRQKRFIKLQSLKLGTQIDVRDTQHIWCSAFVLKIYYKQNKISSILVHYRHWAKLYNEVIDIKSMRLAPWGCFSQRKDLPRYNLHQENENLRGTVINGNQNYQYEIIRPERQFPVTNQQLQNLQHAITTLRNNITTQRRQNFGDLVSERLFLGPNLLPQNGFFGYHPEQQEQEDEDIEEQINLMVQSSHSEPQHEEQQQEQEQIFYEFLPQIDQSYGYGIQRLQQQNQQIVHGINEQQQQSYEMYQNVRVDEQNESGMVVVYRAGEGQHYDNIDGSQMQQGEHDQQGEEGNQQDQYKSHYSCDNY